MSPSPPDSGCEVAGGMHGDSKPPCRAQVSKELKSRDVGKITTAVESYARSIEQHWIKRLPWMVYGGNLSHNELNALVHTATRTERSACEELPRRAAKQKASSLWWEPTEDSELGLRPVYDRGWKDMWPVDMGGNSTTGAYFEDLDFIDLEELKRRHRTPLADPYLAAKISLYSKVAVAVLHCM